MYLGQIVEAPVGIAQKDYFAPHGTPYFPKGTAVGPSPKFAPAVRPGIDRYC